MIHRAKDLSQEQKTAIESLLGRAIAENEAISVRPVPFDESGEFANTDSVSAPDWLQNSWEKRAARARSALHGRDRH